jgi:hypothetical protein
MTSKSPLSVIGATGCGPLDDSGGITGWQEVKTAFSRPNPRPHQRERKAWARNISPLGSAFDPANTPSLETLNREGEFVKFARLCRRGEEYGEDDEDEDDP